jgi:cytochrome d ubiquinol oxidase subunit I
MGISAYHLIRKQEAELFKRSFEIAAIIGLGASIMLAFNGHAQAQHMVETQPMKMASAEALWQTQSPASFSLLTIANLSQTKDVFAIRLPRLLCLLAYNNLDCTVQGIYNLQDQYVAQFGPGDYIPPVAVIYWSFRAMVGIGFLMIALALWGLFMAMGDIFEARTRALRLFFWAIPLPYLANSFGWILTEVGRFPWVVYGLMTLDQGVSNVVPAGQIVLSLVLYTLVYAALIAATIYLFIKYARVVPSDSEQAAEAAPSLVGGQD